MLLFHIALALNLLALVAGAALYLSCKRSKDVEVKYAKLVAGAATVLAIVSTLCTLYSGIKHWRYGCCHSDSTCMVQDASSSEASTESAASIEKKVKGKIHHNS